MAFGQKDVLYSSSYKKLYISDILNQVVEEPMTSETSRVIMKAHILGVITGIKKFHQRTLFTIDDGTGEIECILWHKEPVMLERVYELKRDIKFGNVALTQDIKNCALSLLEKSGITGLEEADKYDHGDIISCLGNIRFYRGKIQLEIHHHYETTNADSESLWILDVLSTKKTYEEL